WCWRPAPARSTRTAAGPGRSRRSEASGIRTVGGEPRVDAAFLDPQGVAFSLLGVEEALPDLLATIHQARAHLALWQGMAGIAHPGARAAVAAVSIVAGAMRMPGPLRTSAALRRWFGPGRRCAHATAERTIGVIVAQRAATGPVRRVARAPFAAVSQRPQRHP